MELKVGDFGLATKLEFEGDRKKTVCGTPNYIAPEILEGRHGHSYEVDIWSFGVILYTLLIGKPPYETSDVKTTYHRIKTNSYSFPDHVPISDSARNLISRILNLDPTKRPKLDEILDHPFFHTSVSIPKLLPASTLACPPSISYLQQYMPSVSPDLRMPGERPRLESTAPVQLPTSLKTKEPTAKSPIKRDQKIARLPSARDPPKTARSAEKPASARVPAKGTPDPARVAVDPGSETAGLSVWVKKWADYSSKYGLGYILSNGCPGIFFNDSTKIMLDAGG